MRQKMGKVKTKYLITAVFLPKIKLKHMCVASECFQVACFLAKPEKPFDGGLMKPCLISTAGEMCL